MPAIVATLFGDVIVTPVASIVDVETVSVNVIPYALKPLPSVSEQLNTR